MTSCTMHVYRRVQNSTRKPEVADDIMYSARIQIHVILRTSTQCPGMGRGALWCYHGNTNRSGTRATRGKLLDTRRKCYPTQPYSLLLYCVASHWLHRPGGTGLVGQAMAGQTFRPPTCVFTAQEVMCIP